MRVTRVITCYYCGRQGTRGFFRDVRPICIDRTACQRRATRGTPTAKLERIRGVVENYGGYETDSAECLTRVIKDILSM